MTTAQRNMQSSGMSVPMGGTSSPVAPAGSVSILSNWCNQAQVSAYALTMGASMLVIQLTTYLQSLSYQELQKMLQEEGDASKAFGAAQQEVTHRQATATRQQGLGQIVGGSLQLGAEFASGLYTKFAPANKQIDEIDTQMKNVDEWKNSINNPPQNRMVATNGEAPAATTPQGKAQAEAALRNANMTGPVDESSLSQVNANDPICTELRETNLEERKALQSKKTALESGIQSARSLFTSLGQMGNAFASGAFALAAAAAQRLQAIASETQQAAQFSMTSLHQANESSNQLAQSYRSDIGSEIQTLLGGIAQANAIRG